MICDWWGEGPIDGSDEESCDEKSAVVAANDAEKRTPSGRKSWGNASFASNEDDIDEVSLSKCERSESILWRRVDLQFDLLAADDLETERTIATTSENNNPSCKIAEKGKSSLRSLVSVESSKQQRRSSKSNFKRSCNDHPNSYQHEPSNNNGDVINNASKSTIIMDSPLVQEIKVNSSSSEDEAVLKGQRPTDSLEIEASRCPSSATEILAVVGAQRERRKSAIAGAMRASIVAHRLLGLTEITPKTTVPVNDAVTLSGNNTRPQDTEHNDSDSEEEINRYLASIEKPAIEKPALDLISKVEETTEYKAYNSQDRATGFVAAARDSVKKTSSRCPSTTSSRCPSTISRCPSNASEVLAVVGAQRERRKSTIGGGGTRASIVVNQLLGLVEPTPTKDSPANDTMCSNQDSDSDEEIKRFLASIEKSNPTSSSTKEVAQGDRSTATGVTRSNIPAQELLELDNTTANRGNAAFNQSKNYLSSGKSDSEIEEKNSEDEVNRFLFSVKPQNSPVSKAEEMNFNTVNVDSMNVQQCCLQRNKGAEEGKRTKPGEYINIDMPSSSEQILAIVSEQRQRRKDAVNDIRKSSEGRSRRRSFTTSCYKDDELSKVSRLETTETGECVEESGELRTIPFEINTFISGKDKDHEDEVSLCSAEPDLFKKQKFGISEHNDHSAEGDADDSDSGVKRFLDSIGSEALRPGGLGVGGFKFQPPEEAKSVFINSAKRERRQSLVSNIRLTSNDRCSRRSSLSGIKEITFDSDATPKYMNVSRQKATESSKNHSSISNGALSNGALDANRNVLGTEVTLQSVALEQVNDSDPDEASILKQNHGITMKDSHTKESRSNPGSDAAATALQASSPNVSSPKISSTTNSGPGAMLAVQLLMCTYASRANRAARSGVSSEKLAFSYFSLLSVNSPHLLKSACDDDTIIDNGSTYLDPFIIKSAAVIDQFPLEMKPSQKGFLSPEALSTFCVPNGISIRFFPRSAIDGAYRLGWLGKKIERYQVHSFTDEKGDLSHGISITTLEELHCELFVAARITAEFLRRRKRRRAGRIIVRWCCEIYHSLAAGNPMEKYPLRRSSGNSNYFSSNEGELNGTGRPNLIRNIRRLGSLVSSSFLQEPSLNTSINSIGSSKKTLQRKLSDVGKISRHQESPSLSVNETMLEVEFGLNLNKTKKSDVSKAAASQAFSHMTQSDKLGDVCVVERCYVLVGTNSDNHSLLFCALQQLVDIEREDVTIQQLSALNSRSNMVPVRQGGLRRLSIGINGILSRESPSNRNVDAPPPTFSVDHRHSIIRYLQKKLVLSHQKARMPSENEKEYIEPEDSKFDFTLPHSTFGNTTVRLPLPSVTREWGLAMLLLKIKAPALLVVLKLLLLERSVLVVGRNFEEVTICASALRDLLDPFQWASAFIPLLPIEMIDFVSAPVPFIAGVVVTNEKEMHHLESDLRVKDAVSSGLSIVNLWRNKVRVTHEPEIAELVGSTCDPTSKLFSYQQRLEDLANQEASVFNSFRIFFTNGLSFRERLTLKCMKNLIKSELSSLTTISTEEPVDWGPYGEYDESSSFFDFSSAKFVEMVMFKMLSKFKYLEIMTQTQLFVGYVESRRNRTLEFAKSLQGAEANFIALWLNCRWKRYLERKRESTNAWDAFLKRCSNKTKSLKHLQIQNCARNSL
mmetsp:Transcript_3030/g.4565  ORF Transcript_3030/g.4565 Transcript_3030/m.4565 type:complete len:1665 (-) Transcript_3030:65-5059(-)